MGVGPSGSGPPPLVDGIGKTYLYGMQCGSIFLSHTVIDGRFSLRLCIGQVRVNEQTVLLACDVIKTCALGLDS